MLSGRRSLRFLASSQSARSFATHPALLFPRPPVAVLPKSSKKKDDSPKPRGVRIPSVVGGKSSITRDPLKFLKTINALLEDNNLEKALAFTRANTRGILTLPSWNRIIEYNLAAQNPTDALKAFNDMKKRGVEPNSFTYSHILRGIAKLSRISPKLVASARTVYESIEKKEMMHTNLMLVIYKKSGAIDEMWPLISKLENRDIDKATYSILFEALSYEEDKVHAAEDGLRAWNGIISRWQRGGLEIDDRLVSSFFFLLAHSKEASHWKEIFKIAESMFPTLKFDAGGTTFTGKRLPMYTEPVLIPLLKAANNLKNMEWGDIAWNHYRGSPPTITTHHRYLYILQSTRAANKALEFLETMATTGNVKPDASAFVIALRSCYIHAARPPFLNTAEKILRLAETTLGTLSEPILQTFLNLFLASKAPDDVKRGLKTIRPYLAELKPKKGKEREVLVSTINQAFDRGVIWAAYEEPQWKLTLALLEGKSQEEIDKLREIARKGDYKSPEERKAERRERGTRTAQSKDGDIPLRWVKTEGESTGPGPRRGVEETEDPEGFDFVEDELPDIGEATTGTPHRKWRRPNALNKEQKMKLKEMGIKPPKKFDPRSGTARILYNEKRRQPWEPRESRGPRDNRREPWEPRQPREPREPRVYETLDGSKKYDSANPDAFVIQRDSPIGDSSSRRWRDSSDRGPWKSARQG
ncbi:hypothetical protein EX30DRAFT_363244 [Ascodesmis nigricans]|uniref:Pentatricopeptide repeat protein n=1 Tax=Ascodesmis nigricans TaxID=341454 RepID=A0A4S2MZS1_9PEZI|nr:hypothetical protein EX30DRAFT_363244 [Ascodesmis nigricans]